MTAKVSPAQLKALRKIAGECGRHAQGLCAGLPEGVRSPTICSLLTKGLVEVARSTTPVWDTEVVSNRFGRGWHTRRVCHYTVFYRVTPKGAAALDSSAHQ